MRVDVLGCKELIAAAIAAGEPTRDVRRFERQLHSDRRSRGACRTLLAAGTRLRSDVRDATVALRYQRVRAITA
jgi:hypothetical protein